MRDGRRTRRSSLASSTPTIPDGVVLSSAAEALEQVRAHLSGHLLLASDFDGTISRPSMDMWQAAVVPTAQRALRRLAVAPRTAVAFISGRAVADLAPRVGVGSATYHGDHGAEWASAARGFRPTGLRVQHEPVEPAAAAMAERLRTEVPRRIDEPWLVVEDKGPAVTFHFRRAPDVEAARARVQAAVDAVDPGGVMDRPGGSRAWELRPQGAATKGRTLVGLMRAHQPETVLMLGDDRHDAVAFDVLRHARAAGEVDGLAIAVVSPAADTRDMAGRADLVLADAGVTARFLALLVRERHDPR